VEDFVSKSKRVFAVAAVAVFACVLSCSDETTVFQNVIQGEQVRVTGEVRAWRCSVGDYWNNRSVDPRFAVETGDTARVIIAYSNGWRDTVLTDSVSGFHRLVGIGLHKIIVETRYTWPADTFQFYLERDTALSLNIEYDVLIPDSVTIYFEFPSYADTIGAAKEWEALRRLNGRLGGALNTFGFTPRLEWRRESATGEWMIWNVPLPNRRDNVIEVSCRADSLAEADTARVISPVPLDIHPKGIYICLW
jgi:hypothetical protein